MSGMLLSRMREIRHPYYAEGLGIYLYSGEELSYYIYHHILLLDEDFMEERLFRFIGRELGMEKLESKLRRWAGQADFSELLLVILQDIHYYNTEELKSFKQRVDQLAKKSPGRRDRERADYLLANRRYNRALLYYDRLLHSSCTELMDESFRGNVWLARGIACARQYEWQEAAQSLEKAWSLLGTEDIRRMLWTIRTLDNRVTFHGDALEGITPAQEAAWKAEVEGARARSRFQGRAQKASEWMEKDKIRRAAGLKEMVETWKREYRRSQA